MADENLDPEIIRKLNEGLELTTEELAKLAKSAGGSAAALSLMNKSLTALGKTTLDYAGKMARGEKGAATFNDAIESATQGIGNFLSALGPLGKAFGLLIKGAGMYAKQVTEMSDRLYKSYQGLAETGVTAADGMMGVAEAAQRMGYGLDQVGLDQFAALMTKASQDLAFMSGSAIAGRKAFSELSGDIVKGPVGEAFMNLGMSVEDINDAAAGFVKQQTSLGRIQSMSTEQLRQGAIDYVKELDVLTKLTGVSRKEMESQMDANRRNERFRAAIEKVRREQGDVAADNLEKNMAVMSARFPETAEGLKDIAAGFVNTEAAQKVFRSGMADIPGMLTGDIGPALNAMGRAAKETTDSMGGLGEFGAFGKTFGNLTEMYKAAGMSQQDAAKMAEQVIKEQEDQAKGLDGATRAQTRLQRAQMSTRDSLQSLVRVGVEPATKALAGLARAGSAVAGVPGDAGVATTPGGTMGAGGGATTQGGAARTTAGVAGGAALGAMIGSAVMPGIGTAIGAGLGAIGGGIMGMMGRGPSPADMQTNLDDLFNFTGNTGSREHFAKLEPRVQQAAIAMAQEYVNMTGKKLQVNSAFRSAAEQAGVESGGNPKAAPGRSLHQKGRAIDFQSAQVDELMGLGLLSKYGFRSGKEFGDPPHVYMAKGGITEGPSIAGEAGPEAVVPLPDGKSIPVKLDKDISVKMDKEIFFGGLGSHGTMQMGGQYTANMFTDTKLVDIIMSRLGLEDVASKRMINLSGIGTNMRMMDADFGSAIGGGMARDEIATRVADLVESGKPLNEALQTTLTEFRSALTELVKAQGGATEGEGMMKLMMDLRDLQQQQNAISRQMLQVSVN